MSGIVLSASVRQNLLSLQSTAALLATTQNDLATGKKVNTALDNPTNFFTAQGLDNRASDIANLLDGIGNGVQVLQAANTGITSLQSLVSSAQSIANQVLQSPTGYSTKSNVSSATISGATAQNLLGNSTATTVTGSAVNNNLSTPAAITGATTLSGASNTDSLAAASQLTTGDTLTVNGVTFTFVAGSSSERHQYRYRRHRHPSACRDRRSNRRYRAERLLGFGRQDHPRHRHNQQFDDQRFRRSPSSA